MPDWCAGLQMFEVGRHTESTATKKKGVRHGEELAWDQELQIDLDSSPHAELHVRPRSTCAAQCPGFFDNAHDA